MDSVNSGPQRVAKKADTKTGGRKGFRTTDTNKEEPLFSSFEEAAD
jgi:hypothetical protein